jgi:nucleotide-binding universal stress UspA family protein
MKMPLDPGAGAAPSRPAAPRRPRVLFAAYSGGRPTGALLRARELAEMFEGELLVLRVLFGPAGAEEVAGLARFADVIRRTRAFCDAALGRGLGPRHVLVRAGDFEPTVTRAAMERHADLVVIPPAEGHSGERVTAIATKAGVPVLVAREPMSPDVVVAATDLLDERYPVLSRAAYIAARSGARVVAVHNVPRSALAEGDAPSRQRLASEEVERRRRRLEVLAGGLEAPMDPVVVSQPSTTEAILRVARERDANLVVVGARSSQEAGQRTAAEIVEGSRRSILVMPFASQTA